MRCFASYAFSSLSLKVSSLSRIAFGVLLSVFMAPVFWAQAPVGTISGMVTDPSGAIIKDAPITVRNKATGFARQTTLFTRLGLPTQLAAAASREG